MFSKDCQSFLKGLLVNLYIFLGGFRITSVNYKSIIFVLVHGIECVKRNRVQITTYYIMINWEHLPIVYFLIYIELINYKIETNLHLSKIFQLMDAFFRKRKKTDHWFESVNMTHFFFMVLNNRWNLGSNHHSVYNLACISMLTLYQLRTHCCCYLVVI